MHWGLIPHWTDDLSIGNRMINARAETLTELPSFKLLTDRRRCIIPADGFYRMPVIPQPEAEEPWLDASQTPFAKAKSLLSPYLEELMDAHDVSTVVNSAKYDGLECIQPVSDDEIPSGGQLFLL